MSSSENVDRVNHLVRDHEQRQSWSETIEPVDVKAAEIQRLHAMNSHRQNILRSPVREAREAYDRSKAIYRVARSIVDGVCPSCCDNTIVDSVWQAQTNYQCHQCGFDATSAQVQEALTQFREYMNQALIHWNEHFHV